MLLAARNYLMKLVRLINQLRKQKYLIDTNIDSQCMCFCGLM